ncbi:hypothetical protein C1632_01285 [Microbacterium testaceum]|nr:hypothetical protein C1632_01285 [Microbacterium testaceum]
MDTRRSRPVRGRPRRVHRRVRRGRRRRLRGPGRSALRPRGRGVSAPHLSRGRRRPGAPRLLNPTR